MEPYGEAREDGHDFIAHGKEDAEMPESIYGRAAYLLPIGGTFGGPRLMSGRARNEPNNRLVCGLAGQGALRLASVVTAKAFAASRTRSHAAEYKYKYKIKQAVWFYAVRK
jgi:hypothetical protein